MLKTGLEQEVNRLRFILMNAETFFDHLTDEKKNEIDSIFDEYYDENKPQTRFSALGAIAGYVMRGAL